MQKQKLLFSVLILLLCSLSSTAQETKTNDSTLRKRVNNIVPRVGIGMSRHFISEFGIAFMRSRFSQQKHLGLNTNNLIFYLGFETMTPYRRPMTYGYKIGIETVNIGHITNAGGIEMGYYQRDTVSSFVITPKIGIPLVNGSLAYGFSFYSDPAMRKEIGQHRVALTYCFNRKSDKVLEGLLAKYKKRR